MILCQVQTENYNILNQITLAVLSNVPHHLLSRVRHTYWLTLCPLTYRNTPNPSPSTQFQHLLSLKQRVVHNNETSQNYVRLPQLQSTQTMRKHRHITNVQTKFVSVVDDYTSTSQLHNQFIWACMKKSWLVYFLVRRSVSHFYLIV